jgi:adenylylsulfate kinase-like enzyme
MIVVFFGQPGSGKTTLAKTIAQYRTLEKHNWRQEVHQIDGDDLRWLFNNTDYSKQGRLDNLKRASDIAAYLDYQGLDVVMSVVYPYKEAREYLHKLCKDAKWIYLDYHEDRGKNQFLVEDFERPFEEKVLYLDTSANDVKECIKQATNYIYGEDIL